MLPEKYLHLTKTDDRGSMGEVGTPESLVKEMLEKLPEEVFKSTTTTFLDPAFGSGTFIDNLIVKLRQYGHSMENIQERVYGCEISHRLYNKVQLDLLSNYNFRKLYKEDFLTKDFNNMKFDVIIGNPPYNSTSGGKKLWPLFSSYAIKLLKDGGSITFVTPNTWLNRPHSPKMKTMVESVKEQSLALVDTTASRYFPNIGEDIGYWLVNKSSKKVETKLVLKEGEKEIEYSGQVVAMSKSDELKNSITSKVRLVKSENWHHRDFTMSHKIHINNNELSEEKSSEFNTPVLQTASKVLYGREKDIVKSWKLIINNSGYYSSDKELDKYQKVTNEYGVGLGTYGLLVESKTQALNARSFFNSKAYRFVIEENKTSGFNTEVKYLPLLDVNKTWTDGEIYKYFNLSEEEINLIETTVS